MTVVGALLFGLAFGSFINVAIDRIPRGRSLQGRSHCDACGRELRLLELLPVVSYAALRGRCAGCHRAIGVRSPLMEASSGIAYGAAFGSLAPAEAFAACASFTLACVAVGVLAGKRRRAV
jgi:leader peptidase (prepilin peptidase)/N-methyltransferase